MAEPEIRLTESQVRQLMEFYDRHGIDKETEFGESILIRSAPNLGSGYLEVVALDADGQPTSEKRVLFPT
jgi:hypothetical protein